MNHNRHHAFSLIEMIIVILVVSIIAVITAGYIANIAGLYSDVLAQETADSEALDTFRRMRAEIRGLKACTNANSTTFSFVNATGVTNTFRGTGTLVTVNGSLMARDVTTFSLSYYDNTNGVLSPTNAATRLRIARIGVRLAINRNGQLSDWNGNVFYSPGGTLK